LFHEKNLRIGPQEKKPALKNDFAGEELVLYLWGRSGEETKEKLVVSFGKLVRRWGRLARGGYKEES